MSSPTAPTGKLIRVFIASTFEDMHQERDHLVNEVFPRLRERCRDRGVELWELDLRWGVTEDAVSTDKAAAVCLDNIDACRPYFVAVLGHRYGSPSAVEGRSITEREIRHAAFHGFLPSRFPDLEAVLDGPLDPPASSAAEREALQRCYTRDWETGAYLLTDGADPDDQETVRGLFRRHPHYAMPRTIFFLRTRDFTTKLASVHGHPFFEKDEVAERHINALRRLVTESGLLCFEYDELDALGLRVEEQLWRWLVTDLGDGPAELDEQAAETRSHELFMVNRTRSFVGRDTALGHVISLCAAPEPSTVVVTGPPGVGKSAFLGRVAQQAREAYPSWLVVPHFVGASVNSSSLRRLLARLCQHFSRAEAELPEESEKLRKEFRALVDTADPTTQFVLLLDGLDQLENTDNAHDMHWLPLAPPPNVTFVVSANQGPVLDSLIARKRSPELVELPVLDEKESRHLVSEYLRKMRHDFPNAAVKRTFFSRILDQPPLYVCVALEELRVYGSYDGLQRRVGAFPDDVPALFDQVLKRLEGRYGRGLVSDCMRFVASSRYGMTADELQRLLAPHTPLIDGDKPSRLPDMLWAKLYHALRPYVLERSGLVDFFHQQLRTAVFRRYLGTPAGKRQTHAVLAEYFLARWRTSELRAVSEVVFHLMHAENWPVLTQTLTCFEFIERHCALGMSYELIDDYAAAVTAAQASEVDHQGMQQFAAFFHSEAHVLRRWPELVVQQALNQPSSSAVYHAARRQVDADQAPWFDSRNRLELPPPPYS